MKKLSLILCALLLLGTLCFPTHAADGYEVLENGDFETKGTLDWVPYYLGSIDYGTDAHSGDRSLRITNRQHYTDIARQYVTKKLSFYGQGTYEVSAYVKLANADAQPIDVQIAIGTYASGGKTWATSGFARITADKWTQITAQVNLQWNGDLETAEFYFLAVDGQEGSDFRDLLIDDCSMKTVSYQGPEYAPETTEAPTTETPTTETPTTEAPTTEAPTEAPTTEEPTEQPTTLPEQNDERPESKGQIKTQTWIISGVMFASGLTCLACGVVLIFKKKEVA